MNLNGRRQSSNVDDRRGRGFSGKTAGGLGIGGAIIVGLLTLIMGGSPTDALEAIGAMTGQVETVQGREQTPLENELAIFSSQILAGTEDVWTAIFKQNGMTYVPPKLVLYNDYVETGSGTASSASGPFYNSADQTVYIDLTFFTSMKEQIGADGDFAYAYVIAHEVGHHVQYLLGTLSEAHAEMSRASEKQRNKISVRLELQADFYAGIWAHYDNEMFASIDDGDIEEGLAVAAKIGDDYLQNKSYGRTVPDSFTHGTSKQRATWLKKGYTSGDMSKGDTFTPSYSSL